MTRTIQCKEAQRTLDFDVDQSCDFVARAENEDEALAEITDHLQTVHNWNEIFEPDLEKARAQNVREND
jgi:predicted small metal-binding protein